MPLVTKAKIIAKRQLNAEEFALDLRCPEIAAAAKPGQFVMLRASEAIDPLTPRPLSVFARLSDGGKPIGFTLIIKTFGRGTRAVAQRNVGDLLPVTGPLGNHLEINPSRRLLMVAGGTGIAPAAFAAQELNRAGGDYALLYGGCSRDAVHLAELEKIDVEAIAVTEDGSLGRRGLVTDILAPQLKSGPDNLLCFACGPWEMMRRSAEICAAGGIDCACSLERYMACGIGVCLSCIYRNKGGEGYHTCCQEGPVVDGLEVDWDA
ncbi:MAG TPA: dihydroorotate dehydrogenase electron transfer subunit [Acidobacteriota bacterium]|nr:dihydroorotate dehydrogenase electron transfer subunit [Acidobacteriota bacterium]